MLIVKSTQVVTFANNVNIHRGQTSEAKTNKEKSQIGINYPCKLHCQILIILKALTRYSIIYQFCINGVDKT